MPRIKMVSHLAKLTPRQVLQIRKLRAEGWTQTQLASKFKVSQRTIGQLLRGAIYRKVA